MGVMRILIVCFAVLCYDYNIRLLCLSVFLFLLEVCLFMKLSVKDAFARVDHISRLADNLEKLQKLLSDQDERILGSGMDALVNTLESEANMNSPILNVLQSSVGLLRSDARALRERLEGMEIDL